MVSKPVVITIEDQDGVPLAPPVEGEFVIDGNRASLEWGGTPITYETLGRVKAWIAVRDWMADLVIHVPVPAMVQTGDHVTPMPYLAASA